MKHTATYSPDDNKLRLYPACRLPKEEYDRLKSAGFRWAPKQELFVAPMWTPEREDILLELCGQIDDEDKSLAERADERAERFEDYSESRAREADSAYKAVSAIADNIPLGQPILVGHHSERHARKDAERIENRMRRAVKAWETAQFWKSRAAGAIAAAKYKERPDVRARRIKTIEADKRKRERAKVEAESLIRFWSGKAFAKNPTTGERKLIEITESNRAFLYELLGRMPSCGVQILGVDGSEYFSAWDILHPEGERYKNCPAKTVVELQECALRMQAEVIERQNRWLSHYNNRIEYEKAMLAADGGTVADKTGPEVGGACRCWAAPNGGWAYIQKVNKVSVTLLDNWGNGGANFTRTIPFDKLKGIMAAAEVTAARESGRLLETADKTGFHLAGEGCAQVHKTQPEPEAAKFDALKETLKAGVQVVTADNLFTTPPDIAAWMVEAADIKPGSRRLEPSAGTGNLLAVMADISGPMVAVEINPRLAAFLQRRFDDGSINVRCADFLACNGSLELFDRILMNPPFDHGADIKHIKHALTMLCPGGRLVALCANGPLQQAELSGLGEWRVLPEGSFSEQGTSVNVAMLIVNKPNE